eukprot:CAMPEP_0113945090 /NCGR_PEP_ID=MMETSP1339-20121228/38480_1 /TAXON_ID=94617 /ORGANISM="Fibrocapsa japonica" /LENGTH=350 /DNA_ID=CAMNT_0000950497 /DNA_START=211 /DNA_END=1263 /DNA_ORIENTATION=+ /assembly_acc=CAM_ASM_000762
MAPLNSRLFLLASLTAALLNTGSALDTFCSTSEQEALSGFIVAFDARCVSKSATLAGCGHNDLPNCRIFTVDKENPLNINNYKAYGKDFKPICNANAADRSLGYDSFIDVRCQENPLAHVRDANEGCEYLDNPLCRICCASDSCPESFRACEEDELKCQASASDAEKNLVAEYDINNCIPQRQSGQTAKLRADGTTWEPETDTLGCNYLDITACRLCNPLSDNPHLSEDEMASIPLCQSAYPNARDQVVYYSECADMTVDLLSNSYHGAEDFDLSSIRIKLQSTPDLIGSVKVGYNGRVTYKPRYDNCATGEVLGLGRSEAFVYKVCTSPDLCTFASVTMKELVLGQKFH